MRAIAPKVPTRDTKVYINTGGRDIQKTKPESLVAMGYAQAITDFLSSLTEIEKELKEGV